MKRWAFIGHYYQFWLNINKSTKFLLTYDTPMLYYAVLAVVTIYIKKKCIPCINQLLNCYLY